MQWHIILCTQTRINSTLLLACAFCALIELSNIHFLFYVHAHTLTHALTLKQTHTRLLLCTGCNHHVIARGYIYNTIYTYIFIAQCNRVLAYHLLRLRWFVTYWARSLFCYRLEPACRCRSLPSCSACPHIVRGVSSWWCCYHYTPASLHATTSTDEAPMVCIVWFIVCRERSRRERF